MQREELEFEISYYQDSLFSIYPRFSKYLKLNNEISAHLLDIYDSEIVPNDLEFNRYFDVPESVSLASEILSSISPKLSDLFLQKIIISRLNFLHQ